MTVQPRNRYRAALVELAQLDKSDFKLALRRILAVDAQVIEVERVSYWELAPDHSAIRCAALFRQSTGTYEEGGELLARDFPTYFTALLESCTIAAHDAWSDARTCEFSEPYFRPNGITSMLDVPVWRRGRLAGVLCHEHVGPRRQWRSDEQDFAAGIGNMISVALEAFDRQRAEEVYELLARATNDVLWDFDIPNDIVGWNGPLLSVFRLSADEVAPSSSWWLDRIHPEDRQRVGDALERTLHSNAPFCEQYRWRRGDDSYATVIDRGFVIRDDHGKARRMVGTMLDVTERIALHAQLAQAERMASLGTLAAGVAHEINNPLTYITANLTSAVTELRGGHADVAYLLELLGDAVDGAERVRRIVRDLQSFTRPKEDDAEDLDLIQVIESSMGMAWNQIRHRARLEKTYGAAPRVRANRARLGQVVLNVLINAAQAIPDGAADQHHIRVRTGADDEGRAVIEVSDSGPGIPPELRTRVFDPFFTTKPVGSGSGLGLWICHAIVSGLGGRIDIDTAPGGGCRVIVTLPAAAQARTGGASTSTTPAGPRCRVLLVDDEPMVGRAIRRLLEPRHEVRLVEDGQQALEELLQGGSYDVILCDLMMPCMTGMELHERLRSSVPELARRMVFMSGGAFSQRATEFLDASGSPVLDKPIDPAALGRAITQIKAGAA